MDKFECITVAILDDSDCIGETLSPAIEQEIDTADIVIDGDKVIKNRVSQVESLEAKTEFPAFKGLALEPEIAFRQIAALIEAGLIISVIDEEDKSDLGDCIFILAKRYAEAAHANEMEK